jgi:hypothetical protein
MNLFYLIALALTGSMGMGFGCGKEIKIPKYDTFWHKMDV